MSTVVVPYHLDEPQPSIERLAAGVAPTGGVTVVTADLPGRASAAWARIAALQAAIAGAVRHAAEAGGRVDVIAADCLVALGVVAGLQAAGIDPSIVWFDAHGDLQTVETSASGYPGGMPLRILAGYRPPTYAGPELRPIAEERLLLVGARDLDPPEVAYLKGCAIGRADITGAATDALPGGPLLVHVDLDVVDGTEIPGLRYPVSPGPAVADLVAAVERLVATGRVVAMDVCATWFDGADAPPEAGVRLVAALLDTGRGG